MPDTISLSPPACREGKVCTTVYNNGSDPVQVTVTFDVCGTKYECQVTVPGEGADDCCITPAEIGLCDVTVTAPAAKPKSARLVLPCQ